jgi:bifunctional DNA-binding transcriptional regulator/antitoxin component of YhaV-PrlF toxin-antitoxin module
MTIATLTSKGQLTLPQPLRAKYRLAAGTRFSVAEGTGGCIELTPLNKRAEEVAGILHRPGMKRLSESQIKERLVAAMKRKWSRR